jgi:hypothetical protein
VRCLPACCCGERGRHRVYRQSAKLFLQSSEELELPHPLRRRRICPPPPTLWSGGEGTLACGRGAGGRGGHTLWCFVYKYFVEEGLRFLCFTLLHHPSPPPLLLLTGAPFSKREKEPSSFSSPRFYQHTVYRHPYITGTDPLHCRKIENGDPANSVHIQGADNKLGQTLRTYLKQ